MRVLKAGIALAGITLLVAGCGGGSAAPGTTTRGSAQVDSQQAAHLAWTPTLGLGVNTTWPWGLSEGELELASFPPWDGDVGVGEAGVE